MGFEKLYRKGIMGTSLHLKIIGSFLKQCPAMANLQRMSTKRSVSSLSEIHKGTILLGGSWIILRGWLCRIEGPWVVHGMIGVVYGSYGDHLSL